MNQKPLRIDKPKGSYSHGGGWLKVVFFSIERKLEIEVSSLEFILKHLDEKKKNYNKELEDYVVQNQLTPEAADHFFESRLDEIDKWESSIPTSVAIASFLGMHSILEAGIVELCKELEASYLQTTITRSWNAPEWSKKMGIERCKEFLDVNIGIRLTSYAHWDDLHCLFEVANGFKHARGNMSIMKKFKAKTGNKQKAVSWSERHKECLLKLDGRGLQNEHGHLVPTSDFILYTKKEFSAFLEAFEGALQENADVGPLVWPSK